MADIVAINEPTRIACGAPPQVARYRVVKTAAPGTMKELAGRLARLCHLLRGTLDSVWKTGPDDGPLHAQLAALRNVPNQDMSVERFTDMSAQSIVHGLFIARCCSRKFGGSTRNNAVEALLATNPSLRPLFDPIASPELDPRVARVVDRVAELLAATDTSRILKDLQEAGHADPVLHFYETFLAQYDPKLREIRGVYYTPRAVVDYIVRSVDFLLRQGFDLEEGLADRTTSTEEHPGILVLDPAVGTGAFLQGVIEFVKAHVADHHGKAAWNGHLRAHLLPRLRGFELLMAPHAIAHMKLGMQLAGDGYTFAPGERLHVYLTDTLEEASSAGEIDPRRPIVVVLGNPPYSGHSANHGPWIRELLQDYKRDVPELAKPGQAKWLQDDYVKFIRFAQWRVDRANHGIVAYVTNHAWLSNPTFRGMRKSLFDTFDAIWIYNLHGNSKKRERAPDGGPDENVFDIQQGVAIAFLVRYEDRSKAMKKVVRHAELWGARAHKDDVLAASSLATTNWRPIEPAAPEYLFIPQPPMALREEYQNYWPVTTIFDQGGDPAPGIVTTHDDFAISRTTAEMAEKVERLLATRNEASARELWTLCSQSQWSYTRAKGELADGGWRARVVSLLYRPFDVRTTVYDRNIAVHRRERVSAHFLPPRRNLGLITNRAVEAGAWQHVLCTTQIIAHHALSIKEINYLLPLWLYEGGDRPNHRRANLNPDFVRGLPGKPKPEQVFNYVYAILHSPGYRQRYEELLKTDFPRVPVIKNSTCFAALVEIGERLVGLHTQETPPTGPLPEFPVAGSNKVEKVSWKAGRVYINPLQHFEPVPEEVWTMTLGGYDPAEKWLKDHKKEGRSLSLSDIKHYQAMIGLLAETRALMLKIDAVIANHGGWPLGTSSTTVRRGRTTTRTSSTSTSG